MMFWDHNYCGSIIQPCCLILCRLLYPDLQIHQHQQLKRQSGTKDISSLLLVGLANQDFNQSMTR